MSDYQCYILNKTQTIYFYTKDAFPEQGILFNTSSKQPTPEDRSVSFEEWSYKGFGFHI